MTNEQLLQGLRDAHAGLPASAAEFDRLLDVYRGRVQMEHAKYLTSLDDEQLRIEAWVASEQATESGEMLYGRQAVSAMYQSEIARRGALH